jgi:hypothetical protein
VCRQTGPVREQFGLAQLLTVCSCSADRSQATKAGKRPGKPRPKAPAKELPDGPSAKTHLALKRITTDLSTVRDGRTA